MSDALENKAVEILDKSQAAIASFADKLVDLTKQYGPDVVDAALSLARIDAANHLLPGIVGLVLAAVSFVLARKINPSDWSEPSFSAFGTIGLGITCAISTGFMFRLFDLWNWVGIFEPKLWLAKRILGL